jgi:hypothetical protein
MPACNSVAQRAPDSVTEAMVGVISCLSPRPERGGGSGARVVRR